MTAIIAATAIVGALGACRWAITATPSRARAHLCAGHGVRADTPTTSYLCQIGTVMRRPIPQGSCSSWDHRFLPWSSPPPSFWLPDYAVASMKDQRQDQMRRESTPVLTWAQRHRVSPSEIK